MADEIQAQLPADAYSGETTIVARVFARNALTQTGADIALTEDGSSALFYGDMPAGLDAGHYDVRIHDTNDTTPEPLLVTDPFFWTGDLELSAEQLAFGKLVLNATTGVTTLYDADGTTPLASWTMLDKNDAIPTVPDGVQTQRNPD